MQPNPLAPLPEAAEPSAHVPLRVLVVDDNENLRKTTVWLAEACGDPVESAPDGLSALAVARIFRPDVVLLDIGMPGMNGLEVCEALRRDIALRHVKVIALTGEGDAVMRRRTAQAGFDLHLTKPVDPTMLTEMLGLIRHSLTPRARIDLVRQLAYRKHLQWQGCFPVPNARKTGDIRCSQSSTQGDPGSLFTRYRATHPRYGDVYLNT